MKKALIFSCQMGGGHRAAALALEEHLALPVTQIDLFALLFPSLHKVIHEQYSKLHQKQNSTFRLYQKLSQKKEDILPLLQKLEPLYLPLLEELIQLEKPDILLSTYSLSSLCLAAYKRKIDPYIPLVTAITDLSPHLFWVHPEIDYYLVASRSTEAELKRMGVSREKIILSGIPTSPRFKPKEKEDLVLVSGGGLGLLPQELDFYVSLLKKFTKVKVLCGNNRKLHKKLRASMLPLEVASYLTDLSEDYGKARLLITKPGGMTTFEAVHSRTPLLLFPAYLEQEKSNARFIQHEGMGTTLGSLSSSLSSLEAKLPSYQENMDRFCKSLDSHAYEKVQCLLS